MGTEVWVFSPSSDRLFTPTELLEQDAEMQAAVQYFGSFSDGVWLYDGGDARYMNNSATPNLVTGLGASSMVAAQDIVVGEELTCDYSTFHVEP